MVWLALLLAAISAGVVATATRQLWTSRRATSHPGRWTLAAATPLVVGLLVAFGIHAIDAATAPPPVARDCAMTVNDPDISPSHPLCDDSPENCIRPFVPDTWTTDIPCEPGTEGKGPQ